jgi:uncharacterized protein (DUF302 family)
MAEPVSPPAGLVVHDSACSVTDTVELLLELIEERGLQCFSVVDHSGAAAAHGLSLRETRVVVFGSPVAGTPVMQAQPWVALDLPLKVLVFDDQGTTRICHLAPAALAARYGLPDGLAAPLAGIDALLDALVARASARPRRSE